MYTSLLNTPVFQLILVWLSFEWFWLYLGFPIPLITLKVFFGVGQIRIGERKYSQFSSTILSIPADFSNAVIYIISSLLISSSFSLLFLDTLGTIPSVPITTDTPVTSMLHNFFRSCRETSLYFHFLSVKLTNQLEQWNLRSNTVLSFFLSFRSVLLGRIG